MSNCNCHSLSCGRVGPWISCGNWGCNSCGQVLGTTTGCHVCGCNTCGCVAGDSTPACNPWAPWGNGAVNTACRCGRCGRWGCQGCNTCGSVAGDSSCDGCNACSQCDQWGVCGDYTSASCLTPRFVSIGRTFQRRITQTLCVDDLPGCAESPLTLVSVTVSGQASWEQISECRQQLLRVTVPVAVQIRDCAGRCRTGHAAVTLTIPLCSCSCQDLWRGQLYVAPCIRLAAPVTEDEDGCFDATLEVQAEVYLMRMQATSC